jgi:hypothetical protein
MDKKKIRRIINSIDINDSPLFFHVYHDLYEVHTLSFQKVLHRITMKYILINAIHIAKIDKFLFIHDQTLKSLTLIKNE